ncbi:MAG: thioredoxin family protein [Actinomycetota bacterium]|nr:thioredoxin family protein [Actinomycetota bacterium]
MMGLVVLLAAIALAAALALVHRRYDGRLRDRHSAADLRGLVPGTPGERATLLQFSSAFCAPCRATKRVLHDVAEVVPGVAHVEVDAESHLELVRALGIHKTPTTLVLDGDGREVRRAVGQPSKHAVLKALSEAVPS